MNRVVFLCIIELVGVIGNWSGSFPCSPKTQYSAGVAVTGIGGQVDVGCHVFVIDYGETVSTKDQVFYVFKCSPVFCGPWGEFMVTFLGGEWG
jgi:hypothetical protein